LDTPPKQDILIYLPGLRIVEINGVIFYFEPRPMYVGIMRNIPMVDDKGLTLHFTKKAIFDRAVIPKCTVLVIPKLNE